MLKEWFLSYDILICALWALQHSVFMKGNNFVCASSDVRNLLSSFFFKMKTSCRKTAKYLVTIGCHKGYVFSFMMCILCSFWFLHHCVPFVADDSHIFNNILIFLMDFIERKMRWLFSWRTLETITMINTIKVLLPRLKSSTLRLFCVLFLLKPVFKMF